ncbi:hypothetical protein NZU83_004391, partial [Salmonella enterica subsp. enterica serovar Apapa]|nr:hypothetical protein [Salmonella enterica subsp. enterica serovar Apapa]
FFLIRAGMSADDIPNAGEKRWLSIEAGLLLRAHGLRYPTRFLCLDFSADTSASHNTVT